MYKVTSKGITKGKEWKLTKADRTELMRSIIDATNTPTVSKSQGVWSQRTASDMLESGYRIFEPGLVEGCFDTE